MAACELISDGTYTLHTKHVNDHGPETWFRFEVDEGDRKGDKFDVRFDDPLEVAEIAGVATHLANGRQRKILDVYDNLRQKRFSAVVSGGGDKVTVSAVSPASA